MAFHVDLTLDTRDAESLAPFWKRALGYEDEPKSAKNRLHMDIRVGDWPRVLAEADELVAAGGTIMATFEGHHIVMADPEGNEFCVAP